MFVTTVKISVWKELNLIKYICEQQSSTNRMRSHLGEWIWRNFDWFDKKHY